MIRRRALLGAALGGAAGALVGALVGCARHQSHAEPRKSEAMSNQEQSSSSRRMPVGFVAHGAPLLAIDANKGADLARWAAKMPLPRAYLVISAHWEAAPVKLSSTKKSSVIYDFYGFPDELYHLQHDAPTAPWLADRIEALLGASSLQRSERGLDHGTWVPLRHMDPDARVAVLQLSMPRTMSSKELLSLGRALLPLRDEGVLILGSGNLTHNLRRIASSDNVAPESWASEFDAWVEEALRRGDVDALAEMYARAPGAKIAHPSDEHYRPLLVAVGAAGDDLSRVDFPVTGFEYGNLSRRSVAFG